MCINSICWQIVKFLNAAANGVCSYDGFKWLIQAWYRVTATLTEAPLPDWVVDTAVLQGGSLNGLDTVTVDVFWSCSVIASCLWSGAGIMTSLSVGSLLDDNIWHDVVISRNRKDIMFSVDRVQIRSKIKGEFYRLNLNRGVSILILPFICMWILQTILTEV